MPNHIRAEIPGACVPCPRARTKYGRKAYYPQRYQDWHDMAQGELLAQCGRLLWDEDVHLTITFHGLRTNADLDNALKSVLDAMTGIIYEDDKQVASVHMARRRGEKRTVIEATKLPEGSA